MRPCHLHVNDGTGLHVVDNIGTIRGGRIIRACQFHLSAEITLLAQCTGQVLRRSLHGSHLVGLSRANSRAPQPCEKRMNSTTEMTSLLIVSSPDYHLAELRTAVQFGMKDYVHESPWWIRRHLRLDLSFEIS